MYPCYLVIVPGESLPCIEFPDGGDNAEKFPGLDFPALIVCRIVSTVLPGGRGRPRITMLSSCVYNMSSPSLLSPKILTIFANQFHHQHTRIFGQHDDHNHNHDDSCSTNHTYRPVLAAGQ